MRVGVKGLRTAAGQVIGVIKAQYVGMTKQSTYQNLNSTCMNWLNYQKQVYEDLCKVIKRKGNASWKAIDNFVQVYNYISVR